MNELETWVEAVRRCVEEFGAEAPTLGLEPVPVESIRPAMGLTGFPGFVPLWTNGRTRTAGLLSRPNLHFREWPCVMTFRNQGLTIASTAATLLPQVIANDVLSEGSDTSGYLADDWHMLQERTLALHRLLGGTLESLDSVMDTVTKIELRRPFFSRAGESGPPFEAAHSALLRRVDSSGSFQRYADWIDAAVARQWRTVEPPAVYGPWARRLICSACECQSRWGVHLGVGSELIDWLLLGGAGVDSAVSNEPTWAFRPGGSSGVAALTTAADERKFYIDSDHVPDPMADRLAQAISEQGMGYRGLAHAEAAVAYDESDRPEQAWEALQSAAWWSARNTGETPAVIRRGMLLLAQRRGWTDIEWVVRNSVPGEQL